MSSGLRILFLDDDPGRASAFLGEFPEAVWVQTAEECLARLGEAWDEIHLDHDLGGQVFVDHEREDTGMAVVRWLCADPRPHLNAARFVVHTHNQNAACMMVLHLQAMGFDARACPFGVFPQGSPPARPPGGRRPLVGGLLRWLRGRGDR